MPSSKITKLYGSYILDFFAGRTTFILYNILYSSNNAHVFQFLYILVAWCFIFVFFFIFGIAVLMTVRQYHIVFLVCISLQ